MEGDGRDKENVMPNPFRVLLLGTEEQCREWSGMVRPFARVIWRAVEEIPQHVQPDLVITEKGVFDRPDVGVIRIGGSGPANVHLPSEPSVRELHLACRLLTEIVHLQRQQQAARYEQQQWREAALLDPLTGLPNRRAWDKALARRHQNVSQEGASSSVLVLAIFDLDDFKQVNEKFGHATGDSVLKTAGSALIGSLRQGDLVTRLGGDEFGLLMTIPQKPAAGVIIERVRNALPPQLRRLELPLVTVSAGFTCFGAEKNPPEADVIFHRADAALLQAKQAGKNRSVEFGEK
jgi:diguanylate cyclase (GGDEF)-like protein